MLREATRPTGKLPLSSAVIERVLEVTMTEPLRGCKYRVQVRRDRHFLLNSPAFSVTLTTLGVPTLEPLE